jgi:dTDP-4-amino-4,6-dideoxygalactose transaminase
MWHLYPIRVPAETRRHVFESLRAEGIGVQVNYLPAHWHPAFASYNIPKGKYIESENFYLSEISLPMWVSDKNWTDEYFFKLATTIGSAIHDHST